MRHVQNYMFFCHILKGPRGCLAKWLKMAYILCGASTEDVNRRLELSKILTHMEHVAHMDLVQKSKVKWCVEGDETPVFFTPC